MTRARHPRRWLRPLVGVAAVLLAYYAWPVREEGTALASSILLTFVGMGVLGWAILGQMRRHLVRGEPVGLPAIATLLAAVVVVFAFCYHRLEVARPGQMSGLETKTDSLYFAMQLLTTVGLGDVSAQGQVARIMVMIQMAFDLVFVAAAGSLLAGSIRERMSSRPDPTEPQE